MLDGQRIAILVEDGFEDLELTEPMRVMKAVNARVIIVGSDSGQSYRSKSGKRMVTAEVAADMVKAEDFDAIIILGLHSLDGMRFYSHVIDLLQKMHGLGKVIAAIGYGPQLLISAGMVRGRRLTSWPAIAIDLRNAGADWVDESVVQDGNIITSRKLADLPMFDKAIIDAVAANSQYSGSAIP